MENIIRTPAIYLKLSVYTSETPFAHLCLFCLEPLVKSICLINNTFNIEKRQSYKRAHFTYIIIALFLVLRCGHN